MSSEAIRESLSTYLITQWAAQYPSVPLVFENQKFDEAAAGQWVYAAIHDNYTGRAELGEGTRRYHTYGVVDCQVFVREGTGTKASREMQDWLKNALLDVNIPLIGMQGSVTCYGCDYRNKGDVQGWWVVHVLFEYRTSFAFTRT